MFHFTGESIRIDHVITVYKLVTHVRTWIIVNDGTAHGQLVEVIVCEMVNDLSHSVILDFCCQKYKKDMERQSDL